VKCPCGQYKGTTLSNFGIIRYFAHGEPKGKPQVTHTQRESRNIKTFNQLAEVEKLSFSFVCNEIL